MFSIDWATSARDGFSVRRERDVSIPLSGGLVLDCDIVRPDRAGRFPVILGVHAYPKSDQFTDLMPEGLSMARGHMEAGDSAFFARRGYVHVVVNIRGTGGSGGYFGNLDQRSIADIAEVVEWIAAQPWSTGRVGHDRRILFLDRVAARGRAEAAEPALHLGAVRLERRLSRPLLPRRHFLLRLHARMAENVAGMQIGEEAQPRDAHAPR